MLQYWNLISLVLTTILLLGPISLAEAGGSFEACDEKEMQGNCQVFDLSDYEQGVDHPFSFTPRSGYRDSDNLEECTYVRFVDEDSVVLCTLSHAFGFVIRDAKFFSRDIAAFQWGRLRYCRGPKGGSGKDGPNRRLTSDQRVAHLSQHNRKPAGSIRAGVTSEN